MTLKGFVSQSTKVVWRRVAPAATMVAALWVMTPIGGGGPAFGQSFGEALSNMQRDFSDLFGGAEDRRRMIRRGDARRAGRPVEGDEIDRYEPDGFDAGGLNEPWDEAPTPRFKPTPEEVAANEAERKKRGEFNDPEFNEAPLREAQDAHRRAPEQRAGKAANDPLDALLGPEGADQGAALSTQPVKLIAQTAAKTALAAAPEAKKVVKNATAPAAEADPALPPSSFTEPPRKAALQQTAASSRTQIGPAASAEQGGGFLSEPAVQITLAFLVGAGLLGLAILREWRGRGPTA